MTRLRRILILFGLVAALFVFLDKAAVAGSFGCYENQELTDAQRVIIDSARKKLREQRQEPLAVRTIQQGPYWAQIGPDGSVIGRGKGTPPVSQLPPVQAVRQIPEKPSAQMASVPKTTAPAKPAIKPVPLPVTSAAEEKKRAVAVEKNPAREVKTQHYLFDRRGPEEVGQLATRFLSESPEGMVVSDLQDASREYVVPKARFFREEYLVPTEELLKSSNALRMPNSPGYIEKK